MPLLKGKKNIGKNVKKEMESGKHHKQAVAIALNVAKYHKTKGRSAMNIATGGRLP